MTGIEPVVLGIVKSYAAKKFLDYTTKSLWSKIFPSDTYKVSLIKVISDTIKEFEKLHPYDVGNNKFPFYHSQILFENLTSYILFNDRNIKSIQSDFAVNNNIIIPSEIELKNFYDLFYENIKKSKDLNLKFIDENYKNQIFLIGENIAKISVDVTSIEKNVALIQEEISSGKLHIELILESLKKQAIKQLSSQTNSGKYLRNTFIEAGNYKELMRLFTDSIFFSGKLYDELQIKDFRLLNKMLHKNELDEFNLNFDDFIAKHANENFSLTLDNLNLLIRNLIKKKDEIQSLSVSSNSRFTFERKITEPLEELCYLTAKIILITETAGQGKSNFLCDLTENFLLKRNIPTVFLTGIEIDASDIRKSILKRIFPERSSLEFSDLLKLLEKFCYQENKFFVIIIDGINESLDSKSLSKNLETFISDMMEFDFVKIVLSCRTEYYDDNFANFEKSAFREKLVKIESLLSRHNVENETTKKLFNNYIIYFEIQYDSIKHEVKNQLTSNFLLLRIFCEAFKGKNLGVINNIYKEELFENYYREKTDEINERIGVGQSKGKFDIKKFINKIVGLMVEQGSYANVPIELVNDDPASSELFQRFLDENILIKRDLDLSVDLKIFSNSEVVNFTFDEFRDYLITQYLTEILYVQKKEAFEEFLINELNEHSPIMEGCSTFLFYKSRRTLDNNLVEIVKEQAWYNNVFSRCIFNVRDETITQNDKNLITEIFKEGEYSGNILRPLVNRRDTKEYQNLNIEFLFEILRSLDDLNYKSFIGAFGYRYDFSKIEQRSLVEHLEKKLSDMEKNPGTHHKLYEILPYMLLNEDSWKVAELYEMYHFRFSDIANDQLKRALTTQNPQLKEVITLFMEDYGISL